MDERGLQQRTEKPVYLKPWEDVTTKDPMTTSELTTDAESDGYRNEFPFGKPARTTLDSSLVRWKSS